MLCPFSRGVSGLTFALLFFCVQRANLGTPVFVFVFFPYRRVRLTCTFLLPRAKLDPPLFLRAWWGWRSCALSLCMEGRANPCSSSHRASCP